MKKNKKIISVLIFSLSFLSPLSSLAYSFNVGPYSTSININEILQEATYSSISQIAQDASTDITESTEQRYGITHDIWRTAERKLSAPRVEIFFDNANPKAGEKVTAHAIPEFFKNDPQNLYYTWYLIHTTDGRIQTATNSIANGKKEAAGILARGDYDPDLDGQTYPDSDKDPDSDGWPAVDSNSFDEDATAAPMGGSDGVGGLTEETVDDFSSATEWCDSLGDHTWDKCSYSDTDASKPLDTYFTLKSSQANHYCDQCKDYFSAGGTAAYTSAKTARNNCCYTNTPEASLQCSSTSETTNPDTGETTSTVTYYKCAQDANTDYCGVTESSLFDTCYTNFKEANKSIANTCLSEEYASCKTDWATTHEDTNDDGFSDYSEQATSHVSRCYKHNFGTNTDASIFRENELANSATDNSSGLDFPVNCKHKWSSAAGYKSGSGKFPTGEEKYWKTDPTDPDTDGDGSLDEADVIGLNQQSFTWNYQPGDRVGVVAEGTSMIPVEEKSAYYKIMWGYLDVCDSTKKGLMDQDECDGSGDYGFGFFATKSPNEDGEDKLKLSLSFSPDSPLADPGAENEDNITSDGTISDADQITVSSSLDNTEYNPASLYYTWQISKGDPKTNDWTEIKDISGNFNTTSPSSGMGISQFSFMPKKSSLSKDASVNYFKVTLTASKASSLETGRGRSSVIIPVNAKGVRITLHKVDVENGKATIGEEICKEGLYKSLCPAVKGQMLAAQVSGSHYRPADSQFSWQVNGSPAYPPANATQLFDGWNNSTIFFPITKEEQEIENISVTATAKDELQPAVGTRLATVVHPALFIGSGDTSLSWPKIYTAQDPDRKSASQSIESSNSFEALTGNNVPYYLDFVPYYLLGEDSNSEINWSINGTEITSPDFYENNPYSGQIGLENGNRTLKLPSGEVSGIFTTLSATVKKYWSDDERNIAYQAWGVVPETLSGKSSVSIESVTTSNSDVISSTQGPRQILAAIGTHLPHYFMYLLRLVLTLCVMFVVSAGFYGLSQKLSLSNEGK